MGALFSGLLFIPLLGFHGAMYFCALLNVFTFFIVLIINKKHFFRYASVIFVLFFVLISLLLTSSPLMQKVRLQFVDSFFSVGSAYHDIYYAKPVYSTQSPYQHIMVLESPFYGRQLVLDCMV